MRRRRVPGFAACSYSPGSHFLTKLDCRNKTVPACAIPLFCSHIRTRSEGGERAPHGRSETHRDARPRIVERLNDVAGQPLEAIDVAPGRPPSAEIRREP